MKIGVWQRPNSSDYKKWTSCKNGTIWVIANKYAGKLGIITFKFNQKRSRIILLPFSLNCYTIVEYN